jgi:hypothetical protein
MAAVRRNADSKMGAVVVVFYKEIARILNLSDPRATRSVQGSRSPGSRAVRGVAAVVVHEILQYFLPGRPHDADGVFKSHVNGNVLERSSSEISAETLDALRVRLLPREESLSARARQVPPG